MAVHDVAADKAKFALQIDWRVDLRRYDGRPEIGGMFGHGIDDEVSGLVFLVIPVAAIGQFRGELLAEQAGDVHARWRKTVVNRGWQFHLDNRLVRPALGPGVSKGLVHIIERWRNDDAAGVMLGLVLAGKDREIRQFGKRHIHPERPRSGLEIVHPAREFRRHVGPVDQLAEQQGWPHIGGDDVGRNLLATLQPDARDFAAFNQHFGDRGLKANLNPHVGAGLRHIAGDFPHAADAMAPHALLAVDLAKDVVEQNIGAARRIDAGVIADHRIKAERRLDMFILVPAIEEAARRFDEQVHDIALGLNRQASELAALSCGGDQGAEATPGVRRCRQSHIAQHLRHPLQRFLIFGEGLGIFGRIAGEFGLRPRRAAAEFQIASFVREEIADRPLDDPPAAFVQPHVLDDFRAQQADGVAGGGIAEAGVEFLRHRSAADNVAAFQNPDLQPGPRQIEGADQTIVTTADDQGVIAFRHSAGTDCKWRRLQPGAGGE